MARISTYQSDTSVEKDDKFLGSNFGGTTKNFAVQDIARFLANTNAVSIAGQFTYQYKDQTPYGNGTMRVSFSSGATFQNAGSIKISKSGFKVAFFRFCISCLICSLFLKFLLKRTNPKGLMFLKKFFSLDVSS